MDKEQFENDARRLQALFGLGQPTATNAYMFIPEAAIAYIRGSTVRSLAPRYAALPSGVTVPAGARLGPAPIEFIRAYVTTEELLGSRAGLDTAPPLDVAVT